MQALQALSFAQQHALNNPVDKLYFHVIWVKDAEIFEIASAQQSTRLRREPDADMNMLVRPMRYSLGRALTWNVSKTGMDVQHLSLHVSYAHELPLLYITAEIQRGNTIMFNRRSQMSMPLHQVEELFQNLFAWLGLNTDEPNEDVQRVALEFKKGVLEMIDSKFNR